MASLPLDPAQQSAVEHRDGPCLVLAGPGSGKTRIIVQRFLALLGEGYPADRQLVLTYTVKAAAEMRERAEAAHGPFRGLVPLTTFHSFAQQLLRDWGWLIEVSPAFHVADPAERWIHLEAVLSELRPATLWNPLRPHDLIETLLQLIAKAKQELIAPHQYGEWAQRRLETETDAAELAMLNRHAQVAAVYAGLDHRYRTHAVLDYDDCILLAERLLGEAAVRRAVSDRIGMVMVDEYQDTDFAQARLVESLVCSHRNLLVVADDDQAIYKFRGASRANLERFDRVYGEHPTIVLNHNYRSTPELVAAGAAVIATAPPESRIEKRLLAHRGSGATIELWEAPDDRAEALAIANWCAQQIEAGRNPGEIAWLFRIHADMSAAMSALQQCHVPYQVQGGRGFFRQPEIKDLLALLTAVAEPANSQALLRCLHLPAWSVSNRGRMALVAACRDHDTPLLELIRAAAVDNVDADDAEAARHGVEAITELHAEASRADVRDLFHAALEASQFLGIFEGIDDSLSALQAGANLNKFGELLDNFADWNSDLRLGNALHHLDILRNSNTADEMAGVDAGVDGVTLLTAHSAKGLEWPAVVVSRCIEARWPGRGGFAARLTLPDELVPEAPPLGDSEVDENRRLFYVAITRARDLLLLTAARRYPRSFRDEKLSPFLDRLLQRSPDGETPSRREVPPAPPLGPARPRTGGAAAPRSRLDVGVSDIAAYKACPRRYQYRKVFRMPVPQSMQRWYGTLVHEVLQTAGMMRRAGETVDANRIAELWQQAWADARGPKGSNAELRTYGEQRLRAYVNSPAWAEASIDAVEDVFALPLDHADVHGRFDRIDRPNNALPVVVDYKTGPPRNSKQLAGDLQVRAYAVALSKREQVDSVAVELHYLQTAEVTRLTLGARELDTAYKHLSASAAEMSRARSDGAFPPHPSTWQCRRCDYRTVCDEGRAQV